MGPPRRRPACLPAAACPPPSSALTSVYRRPSLLRAMESAAGAAGVPEAYITAGTVDPQVALPEGGKGSGAAAVQQWASSASAGMIPRAAESLFAAIEAGGALGAGLKPLQVASKLVEVISTRPDVLMFVVGH